MTLCDDSWESPTLGVGAGLAPKSLPLPWREELSGFSWTSVNIYSIYGPQEVCLVKEAPLGAFLPALE